MRETPASPLPDTASSPLDERRRRLLAEVAAAEREFVLGLPSDDPLDPKRRFRVEATRGEMFAQPDAVTTTLAVNQEEVAELAGRLSDRFDRVLFSGAGDSFAVMIAARSVLESMLGVPCEPVQSLELAYYLAPLVGRRTAVVALSSSGETTRTVEAVLVSQQRGAYTVCLTNTAGSTLDREADASLRIVATRVGWPTQSSTAALALLYELAVQVGIRRRVDGAADLVRAMDDLPAAMAFTLERLDRPVADLATREVARPMVLFCGGGPSYAAAVMGAAKVKECTPGHALAVQLEEYHHYNSQKAGEPLFLLAPSGPTVPRAVDTAREARRWGGRVHVVTTDGEDAFDGLTDTILRLPTVPEPLSPLLSVLPAQLVGYHLGMAGFAAAEAGDG